MSGFKDKASKFDVPDINFGKIHGHTKIELTSVIDGSKKVVEHDNTFQPGVLSKYMRSFGVFNNNPFANTTWRSLPLWRNLFGGIFLFKGSIDNSNGEVEYMPAGNVMTGNGSYSIANASLPSEFGTWNDVESSVGDKSIVMVYDWGTSQGNGTIGCVCLTSETGGYIGYGNPSGGSMSTRRALTQNQETWQSDRAGVPYKDKLLSFGINISEKFVRVTEQGLGVNKFNLLFKVAAGQKSTKYTFSGEMKQDDLWIVRFSEDEFGLFTIKDIKNNSTGRFLIFNAKERTLREQTLTNTTGDSIYVGRLTSYGIIPYIFRTADNSFYVIAPSRSAIYKFSESGVYLEKAFDITSKEGVCILRMSETMYMIATGSYSYAGVEAVVLDLENNTLFPTNGDIGVKDASYDQYNDMLWGRGAAGANYYSYPYKNPLYLATINNLDTPVTKDNTQTMKVTYTLTEVEE